LTENYLFLNKIHYIFLFSQQSKLKERRRIRKSRRIKKEEDEREGRDINYNLFKLIIQ